MVSPSLALLKGKAKPAPAAETPTPAPAVTKPATAAPKGKLQINKPAPKAPAPAPEPEPAPEPVVDTSTEQTEEEVTVDVDKLSSAELDALVKDNGIEGLPDNWSKMKVAEKRATLKAMFGDDTPAEAAAEEPAAETAETPATKPAPAPTKTAVAKTTPAKAAKGVASAELVGPDAIADFAHLVENLAEKDALTLATQLNEETDLTYFKLGGVLALIQTNGWFAPYASFREYVEKEHRLQYRTALYWVGIYNALVEQSIPWEKVKSLGWTKLKVICDVIDAENVDQWVEIAEKQTVVQLTETVNNAKAAANANEGEAKQIDASSTATPAVSTKTFKVHEDQKANIEAALKKCKEASNTDVDTVALELICLDYLSGSKKGGAKAKLPSLSEQLKAAGLDAAFEAVNEAFPTINVEVTVPEEAAA